MKVNAPKGEDLQGGGDSLRTPGTYHFLVTNILSGLSVNGKSIDGFTAECKVLGGLADDKSAQINKTLALAFFAPGLQDTPDQIAKTERLNTAFFVATNCLDPKDLGKEDLEIDENLANGAQFVAKVAHKQKKNGTDSNGKDIWVDDLSVPVKIAYSDVFHVDDPAVAKIPLNKDAIALIEPKHRHKPEWFDFKKPKHEQGKAAKSKDYDDVLEGVV